MPTRYLSYLLHLCSVHIHDTFNCAEFPSLPVLPPSGSTKGKREIIRGTEIVSIGTIRNTGRFLWHSGRACPLLQNSICTFNTDHPRNSECTDKANRGICRLKSSSYLSLHSRSTTARAGAFSCGKHTGQAQLALTEQLLVKNSET